MTERGLSTGDGDAIPTEDQGWAGDDAIQVNRADLVALLDWAWETVTTLDEMGMIEGPRDGGVYQRLRAATDA